VKRYRWFVLVVGLVVISLVLSSCQAAAVASAETKGDFVPARLSAPDCKYGGEFKSIEALDALTVKISLCAPDPAFLSKIAFEAFSIQDEVYLDANQGDSIKMSVYPNASGPYQLKEWIKGDHLTLEANPNYWGAPPKSRELVIRWGGNATERYSALLEKKTDGIDNLDPAYFTSVLGGNDPRLYYRPSLNVAYLGMNNTKPPFNDIRVRQAFAMALNRQRIIEKYYPEGSRVADQFVPPAIRPGYTDNLRWYTYLPEKARSLLLEAGFDFNQEVVLAYRDVPRAYLPNPSSVAAEIQAQLATSVGVKVHLERKDDLLTAVSAGEQAFYLLGWNADYPDATNFYNFHFTSAVKRYGVPYPQLEEEILLGARSASERERQQHYDRVNQLIQQFAPVIPLAYGISALSFRADVQGVVVGPLNENFEEMSTPTDRLTFTQGTEPRRLWCGDETDGETLRICSLLYAPLLKFKFGTAEVQPALAEYWEANEDLTEWTFYLRSGIKFGNGADLDANDVVATYAAMWDASDVNHSGDSGQFEYFKAFFGDFINRPAQ